ncbi:hypothetical protein ONZ45_g16547 [Pleurotus djamor]|nr:hypothetical protein ONZ45_g16547 [Pleurotus djamor]
MSSTTSTTLVVSLALAISAVVFITRPRSRLPLPPGPRKLPIIGNMLEMPTERQWIYFAEMSRALDTDILCFKALQTPVIVLSSVESVTELMIRRSSLTSDRPKSRMLVDLMGWGFNVTFIPYGSKWRTRRRVLWQEFVPANLSVHYPAQVKNARNFLKRLLARPSALFEHAKYTPAALTVESVYGLDVKFENDPIIAHAEKTLDHLRGAGILGTYLVDYFSPLKYIPKWFPFASFQVIAEESRKDAYKMANHPLGEAKKSIRDGSATPSLVSRSLSNLSGQGYEPAEADAIITDVAGVSYIGGADTTPSSITTFFAAMLLFPLVQKKAQEEIDLVLGSFRLPTCEDLPELLYLHATMWEVIRWRPVLPLSSTLIPQSFAGINLSFHLGVVHMLTVEDIYRGYRLPQGSHIFCNIWQLMQDEKYFTDPTSFNPDRFIKDGKIDTELTEVVQLAFGFGRRICPGRFMAMDSLRLWMASTLAVFNITPAKDGQGHYVYPDTELVPGFLSHLPPFECTILPRSKQAESLIRDIDSETI